MRFLIVRVGAMGDVLHALPAITALRAAHPDCEIGWVVDPRWRPLLRAASQPDAQPLSAAMPLVNRIHRAETRLWSSAPLSMRTARSIASLRRELRSQSYDLCIDLQGSIRSAIIGRMSGAANLAGPMHPREWPAQWLYQQRIPTHLAHVVEQACEIVSEAIGEATAPAVPLLPVDPEAEAWSEALLDQARQKSGATDFVVLTPGAGWGAKRWPTERYREVASGLAAKGYAVLINAGPGETKLARSVQCDPRIPARRASAAAEANPLIQVVACSIGQLTSLLRRASLFVGGDTGPLHLAAALQCPIVGIYGPTDPARNGPYELRSSGTDPGPGSSRCIVLRGPGGITDHSRRSAADAALLSIRPQHVLDACLTLLKESQRNPAQTERVEESARNASPGGDGSGEGKEAQ